MCCLELEKAASPRPELQRPQEDCRQHHQGLHTAQGQSKYNREVGAVGIAPSSSF